MSSRKYPPISVHRILNGQSKVDWGLEYNQEYNCPYCEDGKLTNLISNKSYFCQLNLGCNSCKKTTYLTCQLPGVGIKHSPISQHQTLNGTLEVDWNREYEGEYDCPYCKEGKLTRFFRREMHFCKLALNCNSCKKRTFLTCRVTGIGQKHSPVSQHQTLNGILKVDWHQEYQEEYDCPVCNQGRLTRYFYRPNSIGNLALACNCCNVYTYLTCHVPVHISSYRPEIECPNPLCTDIGHNGQKGWIYKIKGQGNNCKCYFCEITFNPNSMRSYSWIGSQTEEKLLPFTFDEDIWQLGHFYDKPYQKILNFKEVNPDWYKQEVKKYLHYLLKSKAFSSDSRVREIIIALRQFGLIISNLNIQNQNRINRNTIIQFLSSCQNNKNQTINSKLSCLREFFNWLDLETPTLIRSRDFLRVSKNDADWLDEVTRQGIKQHLDKIPAPIARHYQVQSYIAARPGDVCQLSFDCLIEENGKWYVKFFQQKTQRWHRILASRKIRKVIEEQQQWTRQVFGNGYSYLFCHFRNIKVTFYPYFPNIKPLPHPPKTDVDMNPMVRIIRMLIEKENVLDANGQKPHFIGRITRSSRLQEIRAKYGMEAAQLYADHKSSNTTFQHYAPPTREQIAQVDLPFQELLLNLDNKFLPWQSLPESLLKNPKAHELDLEIAPRLVVYGHCALDPKTPCPVNLFPKCYGCSSFRPSTGKLPLYERQYEGEQQRLTEAETAGAELASQEAKSTIEAMDKWLPELRRLANG